MGTKYVQNKMSSKISSFFLQNDLAYSCTTFDPEKLRKSEIVWKLLRADRLQVARPELDLRILTSGRSYDVISGQSDGGNAVVVALDVAGDEEVSLGVDGEDSKEAFRVKNF